MPLWTSWWGAISTLKLVGEVHVLHICSHLEHINYCQNWEYNYHVTYANFPFLTSRLPTESTSVTGNKTIRTGSVEKEKRLTNGKAASVISLVCDLESVYRQTVLWSCDGVRLYWGGGQCQLGGTTCEWTADDEQLTINSLLPIRFSSWNSWLIVATLAILTVNLKLPNSLGWKL